MVARPIDEEAIFKVAAAIPSPDMRSEYLQQMCSDDSALLSRLETLLAAHDDSPSFLESPPKAIAGTIAVAEISEGPGTQIGPYKLREQIGEGGFGIVFVAEQQTPVSRKVALKIVKPGMDTRDVIARFEAERQALALMEHPNVARVLDAGATDSGAPSL